MECSTAQLSAHSVAWLVRLQILRRETVRYDDQRGPVALVTILLVVMITAYVISMIWIFSG